MKTTYVFNDYINRFKTYKLSNLVNGIKTELLSYTYYRPIKRSYSQHHEDIQIDEILNHKEKGFYIDIGAFDPKRLSNTYRFYSKGWNGINIEPNPIRYKKFKNARKRDINLNLGIGSFSKKQDFYLFSPEVLSTFSKDQVKHYLKSGFLLVGKSRIRIEKLSTILNKYAKGKTIDFLSIDTEGSEYEVIKNNDWKKFRPTLICIETQFSQRNFNDDYNKLYQYLITKGYKKYSDIGLNTIFLDQMPKSNAKDKLTDIIKPELKIKIFNNTDIPNFLLDFDKNTKYQADIWSDKTYQVDPSTHVFTTIQEKFGNRLIKSLKLPTGAVVVDIGCFIGEKLWQLKDNKNYLGVGVDIAVPSLKTAKKIDIYNHEFVAADMENLPFKDSSVDFVMVFDVIEHLTHAEKGFSEVSRVLKPGGKFLLHIPVKDNKWSLFWWKQKLFPNEAMKDYLNVGHASDRMLTSKQIKNYLKKYDLKLDKEIRYNSFFVHFWDREFFRILALLSVRFFRSGQDVIAESRTTHTGGLGKIRAFYGKYIIPVLEILSFPDWLLSCFKIGNSSFYIATKQD